MNKITIISIRPPALNAKGDQLVLWYRLRALIDANIHVHLILYSKPIHINSTEIPDFPSVRVTYLSHGLFDFISSIFATLFTLYPLEARLFANNKLVKLVNSSSDSKDEALIFYTSRVWYSIKKLTSAFIFGELIDSYSLNYSRRPGSGILLVYNKIQMILHKILERQILEKINKAFVVSQIDADWLCHLNVSVIPNGVDIHPFINSSKRKSLTIGFLGNINYGPNNRAVKWFASDIMPLILKHRPNAKLIIAGNNSERLRLKNSESVQIIGRVASQFQFFSEISVAVAPMLDGSGMQNKVLEAMAAGAPVVATSLACLPIMSEPSSTILVGDTKETFANHILALFDSRDFSEAIGVKGREYVLEYHSWDKIKTIFLKQIGVVCDDKEKI